MQRAATVIDDVEIAVDRIIERVGKRIVLGIPLGLGKPVELTNALYRRAQADPDLKLKIFTALSLAKPVASSDVARAFMVPFVERVFAGVHALDYVKAQHAGTLPPNVALTEFFFLPGAMLQHVEAQRQSTHRKN